MTQRDASDAVDREALMREIHRRVAEKKARGAYSLDALSTPAALAGRPFQPEVLAELGRLVEISPNLHLARSNRRGLGAIVSRVKSTLTRATSQPVIDTANQASSFNALLLAYVIDLGAEVERLRSLVDGQGLQQHEEH